MVVNIVLVCILWLFDLMFRCMLGVGMCRFLKKMLDILVL